MKVPLFPDPSSIELLRTSAKESTALSTFSDLSSSSLELKFNK